MVSCSIRLPQAGRSSLSRARVSCSVSDWLFAVARAARASNHPAPSESERRCRRTTSRSLGRRNRAHQRIRDLVPSGIAALGTPSAAADARLLERGRTRPACSSAHRAEPARTRPRSSSTGAQGARRPQSRARAMAQPGGRGRIRARGGVRDSRGRPPGVPPGLRGEASDRPGAGDLDSGDSARGSRRRFPRRGRRTRRDSARRTAPRSAGSGRGHSRARSLAGMAEVLVAPGPVRVAHIVADRTGYSNVPSRSSICGAPQG